MLNVLKKHFLWIMLVIMITIGIIATVCIFYFSENCNQAGTIGDTLSGVFTSLAFICAIIAIILQSNELSLQREELKQTRTELENQKKEFQIQNQTLKRQQFENTFFNMLKTQENIVSNLEIGQQNSHIGTYFASRRVLSKIGQDIILKLKRNLEYSLILEKNGKIDLHIVDQGIIILDHYFRHLYRIIKFVDETDFSSFVGLDNVKIEKYKYVAILRAMLSPYELTLLFYNELCYPKFKILIEKYSLLQNIRLNLIVNKKHVVLYNEKAYGNNENLIQKYNEFKENK